MIEGSIPLTNGSGSGSKRPKNTWIRCIRIRIRIRNTDFLILKPELKLNYSVPYLVPENFQYTVRHRTVQNIEIMTVYLYCLRYGYVRSREFSLIFFS